MIRSLILLCIIVIVALNTTVLCELQANAEEHHLQPAPEEGMVKSCKYLDCPYGIEACRRGNYCRGNCTNQNGEKLTCHGTHHTEDNELWWWCPWNQMDICGCEDPCPIGMLGFGNLATRL